MLKQYWKENKSDYNYRQQTVFDIFELTLPIKTIHLIDIKNNWQFKNNCKHTKNLEKVYNFVLLTRTS